MNKLTTALLAVVATLLAGCADPVWQGYAGQDVQSVVLDQGPPANVEQLSDGRRAYQWIVEYTGTRPVVSNTTTNVESDVAGSTTANATTTTYVPYTQRCLYTLIAIPRGSRWFVEGMRNGGPVCR